METLETTLGNTKTRVVPSKFWCFTLNNYTMDQVETLETTFRQHDVDYIFGEEKGEKGTPHLQGYIECKGKVRPVEFFKLDKSIHWEKRKGNKEQNIKYCSKEGKVHTNMKIAKPLRDPWLECQPSAWQLNLLNILDGEPDARKIYWYYDSEGGSGKSIFTKHICMTKNAIMVNGKGNDIKCGVTSHIEKHGELDICIMDFPRTVEGYVSYSAIEEIKNGMFFNGKFESSMVMFNTPHIVIFANFLPDTSKLSKDRWVIENISNTEGYH